MDWLTMIGAGLLGGLAMGAVPMLMHGTGFSKMSVPHYLGSLVTGQPQGRRPYLTGLGVHMGLALVFGFLYALAFEILWQYGDWISGLMLGTSIAVVHWAIAGLVLPMLDRSHRGVRRGDLPPLQRYAMGYGAGAALAFLLSHLAFGATFGLLYALWGSDYIPG